LRFAWRPPASFSNRFHAVLQQKAHRITVIGCFVPLRHDQEIGAQGLEITEPIAHLIDDVRPAGAEPATAAACVEPPLGQPCLWISAEGHELIYDEKSRYADQALANRASEQRSLGQPAKFMSDHMHGTCTRQPKPLPTTTTLMRSSP
jgi:hypothetical protein